MDNSIQRNMKQLLAFLLLAATLGCIDETTLDVTGAEGTIVVDGLIGDSLRVYTIEVNESAVVGVGTEYIHPPISGAQVTVVSDAGERIVFAETDPGHYEAEMATENGRSYHVEVTLPNGRRIVSAPEVSRPSPAIAEVQVKPVSREVQTSAGFFTSEQFIDLSATVDLSEADEPVFLRWRFEGEYEFREWVDQPAFPKNCYVGHRIGFNNLPLLDSRDFEAGPVDTDVLLSLPFDYKFSYNYGYNIFQYRISRREYDYWRAVQDVTSVDGSFFDPPPGTVRGNLRFEDDEEALVLGYFSVSGTTYVRRFTNTNELQIPAQRHCQVWPPSSRPDGCTNCLELRRSTDVKPGYWP